MLTFVIYFYNSGLHGFMCLIEDIYTAVINLYYWFYFHIKFWSMGEGPVEQVHINMGGMEYTNPNSDASDVEYSDGDSGVSSDSSVSDDSGVSDPSENEN